MRYLAVAIALAIFVVAAAGSIDSQPRRSAQEESGGSASEDPGRAPGSGESSEWPAFMGHRGDGRSDETGLPSGFPEGGPKVRWHIDTGEGYSMPTIAGGRVFLFDRRGDAARLTALDPSSGRELWHTEYPTDYEDYYGYSNGPRTAPVVDGDRVYTFGVEGRLRCQSVEDGKLRWQIDTAERFGVVQNFFGAGSSPVVEGDLLIVPIGGSPPGSPKISTGQVKGHGSGIVAFDKLSGEIRYSVSDQLASYATPVLTDIDGRRWGFHFARGGLIGFHPTEGKVDFEFPWRAEILESVNAASPVVVGDKVFISETYGPGSALLKVRPGGYDVIWKDEPSSRNQALAVHWNTPVHNDGYLYASSGRNSGNAELRAVELGTGEVKWKQPGLARSTLLLVDGHLVVLTEYGRVLLVEATPEAYTQVAELTPKDSSGKSLLQYPAWAPPALSEGVLYLRGKGGLVAVELMPGR
jgi:outer membrane protein assembly factor BamB